MNILAIDLGTKTGWAFLRHGQVLAGTMDFTPNRYEGGGMRYVKFQDWLIGLLGHDRNIDRIYFEEVRAHKGNAAAHAYGGLLARLGVWCKRNGIPYLGIPVGTIKKHATGKGNSNKAAMLEAAANRGWTCADDNECDARFLLDLVMKDLKLKEGEVT